MSHPPTPVDTALDITRAAQLATLVKENQLVTALICFCLWQVGALATAHSYVGGVMC